MVMLPKFTAAEAIATFRTVTLASWSINQLPVYELPQYYRCPPFCPAGTSCTREASRYGGYNRYGCCAPGEVLCAGVCRTPACQGNQIFKGENCNCECSYPWNDDVGGLSWLGPQCTGGRVWDPVACRCACPNTPCPDFRMARNAVTCACECPPGLTNCNDNCVDLNTDPLFCGSCGTPPCDPFTEMCCNGVCTNVCNSANCGSCGRVIQAGEKCCNCSPRMLGTNTNCSDCGDVCSLGRTCVNGTCQCSSTSRQCAPGKPCCPNSRECCANGTCCSTGTKCCNGACVNTNTDVNNCGTCGTKCPTGKVCTGGVCQCPSGTQAIGTCCCAAGQGCCNGACTSLNTVNNCGSCGQGCFYTEFGTGNPIGWGTCDPITHRCHCPPGSVKSGTTSTGHDSCCPAATPNACGGGVCKVTC